MIEEDRETEAYIEHGADPKLARFMHKILRLPALSVEECLEAKVNQGARYYSLLGLAMIIKGMDEAATSYFKRALELSPINYKQVFIEHVEEIVPSLRGAMGYIDRLRHVFYNAEPVSRVLHQSGMLD
ncbi:hypothetical protein HYY71_01460 [Candidatus Woesearchaeota archaeon]|nr:hypothetical protein [Candidatus Woesearchaeota archaeon]